MQEAPPPDGQPKIAIPGKESTSGVTSTIPRNSNFGSPVDSAADSLELEEIRPVVDIRDTGAPPADRDRILWGETFVFQRLASDRLDFSEKDEREVEEKRILGLINDSGQLGQPLLSSWDASNLDLTLDVLDADASILFRVVDSSRQVLGQCLVVFDHLRNIAVHEPGETKFVWHSLHSKVFGRDIGLIRVGVRFRLAPSLGSLAGETHIRDFFQTELLSDALFLKYDTNGQCCVFFL